MNRSLIAIVVLSAATPLAFDVPRDTASSETTLELGAGYGEYALISRGCEGQIVDQDFVHFADAGAQLEHRFAGPGLTAGVRGGVLRDDPDEDPATPAAEAPADNRYVNPYLALEGPHSGAGIGVVLHEREFPTAGEGAREADDHPLNDISAHLRLGDRDEKFFAVEWMEGVPLYSDGGYLTIGGGGRMNWRPLHVHAGLATGGPYEGAGGFVRLRCELRPGIEARLTGRFGTSGGADASAIAVGARFTLPAPR